jgi:hypothetical protein
MATTYKIHPAIGFARLGNSPETFPGPLIPGVLSSSAKYRDAQSQLKRQGAAFWVYAHDDANPNAEPIKLTGGLEVIPGKHVKRIEWTVHVANKKAAWFEFHGLTGANDVLNPPNFGYPPGSLRNPAGPRSQWTINPGPRTATVPETTVEFRKGGSNGAFPETWPAPFANGNATGIETLGEMRIGTDFGLTVAGGFGRSGSVNGSGPGEFANNPGWFDDTSDGSVKAVVVLDDDTRIEDVAPAWVIVGPPDFAPPIENIVTMHDAMYDVGLRFLDADPSIFDRASGKFLDFTPSFESDVFPILRRAFLYRWVYDEDAPSPPSFHATLNNLTALSTPPSGGSDPNASKRNTIFQKLRPPSNGLTEPFDSGRMPKLHGDQGEGTALTLTATQYEIMRRWRDGNFSRGAGPLPPPPTAQLTAAGLDRAALEACVGGAFFPGIECGWIIREPKLYVTPFEFRFRHAVNENDENDMTGLHPGDVTKRSACPWQADFNDCGDNWWPAQRPNQVRRSATSSDFVQWHDGIDGHMGMVQSWQDLGVVKVADPTNPNTIYFEDERNLPPHP